MKKFLTFMKKLDEDIAYSNRNMSTAKQIIFTIFFLMVIFAIGTALHMLTSPSDAAITYTVNMNALEQLTINCVAIYNPDFSVQKYQVSITGISHDTDTTGRRYPRASTMTYAQLGPNQKTKVKDLLYIFYAGNQVAIGEPVGELPPLE